MSHIFISYSRNDVDFARYLRLLFEKAGFRAWMDEQRLAPGVDWWDEIERSIDACAAFVVVMSPTSKDSIYVKNEIYRALDQGRPIFPVWLAGEPFSLLAHLQYEDFRTGLKAQLQPDFTKRLSAVVPKSSTRLIEFAIEQGSILDFEADVVGFKYSRTFQGADKKAANRLMDAGIDLAQLRPAVGETTYIRTEGGLAAPNVLYFGTRSVFQLSYGEIREFGSHILEALASVAPQTRHLAMTVHGPGFGLDEAEAIVAQFAGHLDALQGSSILPDLQRISIVEVKQKRLDNMVNAMQPYLDEIPHSRPIEGTDSALLYLLHIATIDANAMSAVTAVDPDAKPYALVIMPKDAQTDDIFYYGIQRPVHTYGLLCERMTPVIDEEQVLDAVVERVSRASVVIVDVEDLDPLLTFQIGCAMGANCPTVLLRRPGQARTWLDGQNDIQYEKIWELEERLLKRLQAQLG